MNRHIIQKQVVELTLDKTESFQPVADVFKQLLSHTVLPTLSVKMDLLANEQTTITADRLEINLGVIDWHKNKEGIGDKLVDLIIKEINWLANPGNQKAISSDKPVTAVSVPLRRWMVWKDYLLKGSMPWYATEISDQDEWEKVLLKSFDSNDPVAITQLIKEVIKNEEACERLWLLFSFSFIESIIKLAGYSGENNLLLTRLSYWLENSMQIKKGTFEKTVRKLLLTNLRNNDPQSAVVIFLDKLICLYPQEDWRKVLQELSKPTGIIGELFSSSSGKQSLPGFFKTLLTHQTLSNSGRSLKNISVNNQLEVYFSSRAFEIIARQNKINDPGRIAINENKNVNDRERPIVTEKKDLTELIHTDTDEEKYGTQFVISAGLVIIATYLPILFKATGLIIDGQFVNETAQVKAVKLTGFLAGGKRNTPDWELSIPKILCGLAPTDTIATETLPDTNSFREAEDLLKAVIKNWATLGQVGIDSLREAFLSRRGKLTLEENNWLLQTEASSIDILLDSLPWGIGIIKLPWMPKMLVTEWNIH